MESPAPAALAREHRAARESAALFDESARGRLRVTGRDRVKYLHNMLTQDVKALAPGEGAAACALTVKAKLVSDMRLCVLEDEILLDVPEGRAAALAEHLKKFRVINQVEIEDASAALASLALEGPRAAEVAGQALGVPLPALSPMGVARLPGGVIVVRASISGENGYRLIIPRDAAPALRAALEAAGAAPISDAAAECLRIEGGTPAFGKDIDENTLPPEAGLDRTAISYTKGCYLGQEPIARIRFMGHVNRRLMGLVLDGPEPPPGPGTRLFDGAGKELGRITSAALSPALGAIALGYVRREAAAPGTRLHAGAADGRGAEVRELPLVGR